MTLRLSGSSAVLLVLVAAGCAVFSGKEKPPAPAPVAVSAKPKPELGTWGFDLTGMAKSVRPGDDFFRYANGGWYDTATVPSDRPATGSFNDLDVLSETRTQAIITDLQSKTAGLSPIESKIRDFYRSFVDVGRLEQLSLQPAQKDLTRLAGLKTRTDVARAFGSVPMGTASLFNTGIGVDDKKPDAYALFVNQSGLGLPDRDYYLLTEAGTVKAREAYKAYIAQILEMGGVKDSGAKAARIFALETDIAKLHWPRDETREAEKIYNPITIAELARFAPGFDWDAYFKEMGITPPPGAKNLGVRQVIIAEKSAFPKLAALFAKTPVSTWRDYLTFHYLTDHAAYLPKRFDDANFAFFGKVLTGREAQLPREKRGVRFVGNVVGEGVGEIYVAKYFPPGAKAKAQELVSNLLKVYADRINTRDWMTQATRAKALEKIKTIMVKIGYPDTWRDYSALTADAGDLLGNQQRGTVWEWNRELKRLDGMVDRAEWGMTPQTVNAYYNPSFNEIVFPAAILQPPFFDPNADDAVNYGGIGAVIGHEISHGFDDQGSKYDSKGVLANWWTEADRAAFDKQTAALSGQYDTYSPLEGMHVNGKLTLGENIADLAGLTIANAAYHLSLNGKDAPLLDGYTGEQRFFLGFAQVWRYKSREEMARQRLLTDPHSPPPFRVDGTIRNVDAWYPAFSISDGEKYYLAPDKRVKLW